MDSQQQKNKERVLQWEEKLKISGMCQKFGMTRKMAEERLTKIFVAIWWAAMFGVSIGDQGGDKRSCWSALLGRWTSHQQSKISPIMRQRQRRLENESLSKINIV